MSKQTKKEETAPAEVEENVFSDNWLDADISVEDPSFGSMYPVIQFLNGDPKKKKEGGIGFTGGFFISADQDIQPTGPWSSYTLVTDDGTSVEGFATRDLKMAAVRYRRCWVSEPEGDDGFSQRFSWGEYDLAEAYGKPRGTAHIVADVDGIDEPVLLAFRGMAARSMMSQRARERGVIPAFASRVVRSAKALSRKAGRPKNFPICAFRFTVGPKRDDSGAPIFDTVGKGKNTSQVTSPSWIDTPDGVVNEAEIRRRFVGGEELGQLQALHVELNDWVDAWSEASLAKSRGETTEVPNGAGAPLPAMTQTGGLPAAQEMPPF